MSREQVIEAAMRVVQTGGYQAMTIRSLAAELGVAPMSLYRHVQDKDDLLTEVVDRLLAGSWRPRRRPSDWRAWTAEAAERFRQFLVDQPAALHVYLLGPVVSATALARMEAVLQVLQAAGLDEERAWHAYAALQTYTIGFAALQTSRRRTAGRRDVLVEQLAASASTAQFSVGLRYLLEGIERDVGALPEAAPAPVGAAP